MRNPLGCPTPPVGENRLDIRLRLALAIGSLLVSACGVHIAKLGILVDHVGMSRELLGPSPPRLFELQFAEPANLRRSHYARLKRADVMGDEAVELLVELKPGGHGVEEVGVGFDLGEFVEQQLRGLPG